MKKPYISIVVPLYRCGATVTQLTRRLTESLTPLKTDFEIILVNDASPENDWEIVEKEGSFNQHIKGINLSRNFGQHYAIHAGLNYSSGEWVVVMDGDLQDRPEEIPGFLEKAKEGFDIVLGRRVERQDNFFKKKMSKWFYKTLAYLTETEQNAEVANFGIYHRKVVDAILSMKDKTRYFPAMVKWVGFKRTEIPVNHVAREEGKSGYNFKALLNLALNTILSFSDKPLRLTVKLGIFISFFSFLFAIFTFIRAITGYIEVSGYSSLIISIWFLSGIIITLLGMLGLYIGRTFEQVKDRPVFIVNQTINIEQ
ncbi:glycosyltransferase family 2 protein [Marinilabilia sp.]|uniref:glycosyltransferase family 2 protein n=1 Tax=Marinilabilia sp. TaxID=2021252 RepID=UPI0025BCE001|nr:glycosyltransferase family 2 protein [Marinilabilia sp.]